MGRILISFPGRPAGVPVGCATDCFVIAARVRRAQERLHLAVDTTTVFSRHGRQAAVTGTEFRQQTTMLIMIMMMRYDRSKR